MKVQFVPVVATAVGVGFFVFASPALAQRGTPPPAPVSPLATDALDRMLFIEAERMDASASR